MALDGAAPERGPVGRRALGRRRATQRGKTPEIGSAHVRKRPIGTGRRRMFEVSRAIGPNQYGTIAQQPRETAPRPEAERPKGFDNLKSGREEKMIRRTFLTLAAVAPIAIALSGAASAANVTLRYAHVAPEGETQYWFADQFAKRIGGWTGGRVAVTVFPNSQMGGVQEMIDGVKSGSLSMGHHQFSSLARLVKNIAVLDGPFVYRDGDHAMLAASPGSEVLGEFNEKLTKDAGMRIIGTLYRGARQMTCKFPVYSPADLKGKPFRGVPIPLWTTMVKGMGAIPTPVEVSELPTALMTGLVVGQENPLDMIYANKLYEVQSHVMLTGHMQALLPVFINEKAWQSISEQDRQAILEGAKKLGLETLDIAKKGQADLQAKLTKAGMTFITEKDGLKSDAFRQGVLDQVKIDYPEWPQYYERIAKIGK